MTEIITKSFQETQKLGEEFSTKIKAGGVLCLEGDLGAGKTTFTQGLLKGLGCEGPFTSPTFVLMKKYKENIYHLDAYRIDETSLDDLGWEELITDLKNIIIVEWSERIKNKIPKNANWIKFEWVDQPRVDEASLQVEAGENERKIIFN